ncbi:MCE family protein [Kosakonia sacchari]|nr:MCE family protein [Kosakonia sacchari]
MHMSQETPASPTEARIKTKRRISPFWLLPVIALLIAGWLIWSSYEDRGNTITIDFMSADGIVAGRTPVRYQGVEVGTVQDIRLSEDLKKIEVRASIKSNMKDALRSETQFWLVTPKASLAGVSGLDALVGGNYIGMMPGKGEPQEHFTALDTQPKYRLNNGELMIHLHAPDLGALNSGSLVYFRKIPVGRVYDYSINTNKQGVTIDVLIERRFTNLVKKGSRFWNVSGVKADVGLSGAKVELESLAALVNGAIAFDSPEASQPAAQDDEYGLYEDLAHSQRGVLVKLDLPGGQGLKAGSTPLMYQGLEVGQLTKINLNPGGAVSGELTVDPSVVNLLRDNTRIEMHNPKISLSNTNLSSLLTGSTLELVPGEGQPRNQFVVLPADKNLLQEPGVVTLTLTAPESYGIDAGQPLVLHGVQVGQVLERNLTSQGVTFAVAIDPQYRDLVHGDSKFVVNSRVDVKVGLDGVEFLAASANEWLSGGIRILPGAKGEMKNSYPLFANLDKALENSLSDLPTTTLTLTADTLPDVQAGSVVLYRKFEVGEVITVRPRANAFDIELHIKPEYRNLLTSNSVFWAEGGAKVQLNGSGLTVQAAPLSRAIKGAISFDNLSGASGRVRKGDKRVLYASETAARAVGGQITLHAFDAGKMAAGMPIRYLGIDIGQIQDLQLITDKNEVQASAVLYPEYVQTFARAGSRFSVITPQISAAGVEHLDTLLQPYINVEPGRGDARRDFEISEATITDSRYLDGLNIVVEAPEAGSINIGTPVLFRGIEVGTVTGMMLGTLSDRVMIGMRISKRYQHLVRNNSVFWLASGYSLDFGLVGGVVKTGTFNQFIRGGIAFATPPETPLAPKAQPGKHFLLLESEPKEWRQWGTALPR